MTLMSSDVLTDPAYEVPRVPDASPAGVAWLRASVVRFSRGGAHQRRRALVMAELAGIGPEVLRQRASVGHEGGPVEVLAEVLGVRTEVAADVEVVAEAYHPHTRITRDADQAVGRLVGAFGGVADEVTANRIALLVQAHDATNALVANTLAGRTEPPVPVTRRVAPDGTLVEVDLSDAPFGAGPHVCPGREHALALAAGLVEARTR